MAWHHHDHGRRARTLLLEIRSGLAFLKLKAAMRRVHLASMTKFDPVQPRDDHGRWTTGGGGGITVSEGGILVGDPSGDTFVTDETGEESWASVASSLDDEGALAEQVISNRDGSEIRSEFNPPDNAALDERHTVKTPDGTRTVFERSGDTQTIRDGATGEALSAATWTPDGALPEAITQPATLQQPARAMKTLDAASQLFTWQSTQNSADSAAVLSVNGTEFRPGASAKEQAVWVGELTKDKLALACPRYPEVEDRLDTAVAAVNNAGGAGMSATQYGTAVHQNLQQQIKNLGDENFRAEVSYIKSIEGKYGAPGSVRIDVLEKVNDGLVCVYDIKTGQAELSPARRQEIANNVQHLFGTNSRATVIVEVKPRISR